MATPPPVRAAEDLAIWKPDMFPDNPVSRLRLTPTLTTHEVEEMVKELPFGGQGCGMTSDAAGQPCGYFVSAYHANVTGQPDRRAVQLHYRQLTGRNELFEFDGPGFRYVKRGDVLVSVDPRPEG